MSSPIPATPLPKKISDLMLQYEYLLLLRDHHELWIRQAPDPEIIRMHRDIINLIKQLEERYQVLLETLQT